MFFFIVLGPCYHLYGYSLGLFSPVFSSLASMRTVKFKGNEGLQ